MRGAERGTRSILRRVICLTAIIAVAAVSAARAQVTPERVSFASLDKGLKAPLTATLYRPTGVGPFPAIVLLHTCAGIQPYVRDWAQWFASQNYEALVVDSLGPRGVSSVCGVRDGEPNERPHAYDAYGALAYLRTRSDVDATRIALMGWSHGGGAVLAADDKDFTAGAAGGDGFRAAIALYPVCEYMPQRGVWAPLLLLLGAADDWTSPAPCEQAAGRLSQAGFPVSAYVYPGTTHAFDNPADRGATRVGRHFYTLLYNADSAADAHARITAFLTQVMR